MRSRKAALVHDLAAARARAAKHEEARDRATAWLAHVRTQARKLLAAGDTPTIEVARLLWDLGASAAAYAVGAALATAEDQQLQAERLAGIMVSTGDWSHFRGWVEQRAAEGHRPEQLALEMVDHKRI